MHPSGSRIERFLRFHYYYSSRNYRLHCFSCMFTYCLVVCCNLFSVVFAPSSSTFSSHCSAAICQDTCRLSILERQLPRQASEILVYRGLRRINLFTLISHDGNKQQPVKTRNGRGSSYLAIEAGAIRKDRAIYQARIKKYSTIAISRE